MGALLVCRSLGTHAFLKRHHSGIHWDALDEDVSIDGILAGQGDMTRRRQAVA